MHVSAPPRPVRKIVPAFLVPIMVGMSPFAGAALAAPSGLPLVEPVPGADSQWVGRRMTVQGIAMSLRQFRARRPLDEVIAHHRRRWSARWPSSEPIEMEQGSWRAIAIRPEGYFVSVRARRLRNDTVGYIAVSVEPETITDGHEPLATELPLPRDTRVRSRQTYVDAGRHAEQLILSGPGTPSALAQRFRAVLERVGWTLVEQRRSHGGRGGEHWTYHHDSQYVRLQFRRASRPATGSRVLAIWMK